MSEARRTLLVNVMGGPGLGKRELCEALAREMRALGLECRVFSGRAKEWIEEGRAEEVAEGGVATQRNILVEQKAAVDRVWGKVDVVFTDCSPIQGVQYVRERDKQWERAANQAVKDYRSREAATLNFFIARGDRPWSQEGRVHTEDEAIEIDRGLLACFADHGIAYTVVRPDAPDGDAEVAKAATLVARMCGAAPALVSEESTPDEIAQFATELERVGWPRAHVGFVKAALTAGWPYADRILLVRSLPERERTVEQARAYVASGVWKVDRAIEFVSDRRRREQHWRLEAGKWAKQHGIPMPGRAEPDLDWDETAKTLTRKPPVRRVRGPQTPAEERKFIKERRKPEEDKGGSSGGGVAQEATHGERKPANDGQGKVVA